MSPALGTQLVLKAITLPATSATVATSQPILVEQSNDEEDASDKDAEEERLGSGGQGSPGQLDVDEEMPLQVCQFCSAIMLRYFANKVGTSCSSLSNCPLRTRMAMAWPLKTGT